MQLPKHSAKCCSRIMLKLCAAPGCGKEEWMRSMQKYCKFHMIAANRIRARKDNTVKGNNVEIKHNFKDVTTVLRSCGTCGHDYIVTLHPRVTVYPGHCEKHRNPHQRAEYARLKRQVVGVSL